LDVAIGGHTLGGGYGYMSRKFGLVADYAYAFEIAHVTAEGPRNVSLSAVSADSIDPKERDLFWALRGGGQQNFGIVTKIGFRNFPPAPPLVYKYDKNFSLNHDSETMDKTKYTDFLTKYTQFWAAHSAPGDEYCDVFSDVLLGRKHNESYLWLRVIVVGERTELAGKFLEHVGLNMRNFTCERMSYLRFIMNSGYKNDLTVDGDYFIRRSAYMVSAMPMGQIETLWHYVTHPAYSYVVDSNVQIRSYGCAVSRVQESETAYPHRRAVIKMQYQIMWRTPDAEQAELQRRWSVALYLAMYGEHGPRPDAVMDGCYVSYPDRELPDGQSLYYKGNYERLKEVKRQWDPLDIFNHRQSVQLAITMPNSMKRR